MMGTLLLIIAAAVFVILVIRNEKRKQIAEVYDEDFLALSKEISASIKHLDKATDVGDYLGQYDQLVELISQLNNCNRMIRDKKIRRAYARCTESEYFAKKRLMSSVETSSGS